MSRLEDEDNGEDFGSSSTFSKLVNASGRSRSIYWAVEPTGHDLADKTAGRRFLEDALKRARAYGTPNLLLAVLAAIINQGLIRPIELGWLSSLACKARAGGPPRPFTVTELFNGLADSGRTADQALMRDGESAAIRDISAAGSDDNLASKLVSILINTRAEYRTGYLWAICRAAYAGSFD